MPEPASFEFDGRPPWKGVPVVNGHIIHTAQSIDVHIDPQSLPVVTLELMLSDALALALSPAEVRVGDETREALISLGWTPPGETATRAPAALVQLAQDVNAAAVTFGGLTDAELAATPAKAREGIAAVFGALAAYTDGSSHRD